MNLNNVIEKIKKDEIINLIKKHANGAEIYLVGGCFRDFYLGTENFDKDIVVDKTDAEKFAKSLAVSIDATYIPLDDENKIYRLITKDKTDCIDIAALVGKTIEEDLKRRDLTINSVAVDLKTHDIVDVTGGIEDLKNKKIKHISEQNFIDDPLRLLRAYRFEAILGFSIDEETTEIIKNHAEKIKLPAQERLNYELMKLFSGNFSAKAILEMNEAGILKEILPITETLKTVPPNLHHHLDLFHHSVEIVNQIQQIYGKSDSRVKEHLETTDFGGFSRLAHLKFAGLLHDIGKPDTWTIEEETGKHRFIKHDDLGSKMGAKLLKKQKYSKKQIEYISKMIKNHIYPSHVVSSPEITDKIYMRLIRKMDTDVIDVIILAMADRYSARGVEITEEVVNKNINALNDLLNFYLNIKEDMVPLEKLLSGTEIMEILNIKPSKELGNIIKQMQEAQISGEISTREEAIDFVKTKAV